MEPEFTIEEIRKFVKKGYTSVAARIAKSMLQHYDEEKSEAAAKKSEPCENYYDIDFCGHLKTKIEIKNGELKVIAAMNGCGDSIDISKININEIH